MTYYSIQVIHHIFIGFFLFYSFSGLSKIIEDINILKNNYNYPVILSLYFIISFLIFSLNKDIQIYFSSLAILYLFYKNFSFKFDRKSLILFLIIVTFSFFNGKIIHGASEQYSVHAPLDTYFFVSLIYQSNLDSLFQSGNLTLLNNNYKISNILISFIGYQFSFLKYFDGFSFISISIPIFIFLSIRKEIQFFFNTKIKNNNIIFILLFSIFALPYPLYLYESPYVLLAIPILPSIANMMVATKIDFRQICFILFSILITKIAIISLFFLTLFFNFIKNKKKQNIYFLFLIFLFSFLLLNLVIPFKDILFFFQEIDFDITDLKLNYSGLHKIFHLFAIILFLIFLENQFKIFIFLPSILLYIFFPSSSPGQLFYTFMLISFLLFYDKQILLKNRFFNVSINKAIIKYLQFLPVTVFCFSLLFGLFINVTFFYYFFYFSLFLLCFNFYEKIINFKLITFMTLIIFIKIIFYTDIKEGNVVTINQKLAYEKIADLTEKNSLIFTDFHLSEKYAKKLNTPPWGLYSAISERQFFLSSYYSDFLYKIDILERKKLFELNNDVIHLKINPKIFFHDSKFKHFYILSQNKKNDSKDLKLIFKNKSFQILKFK